MLSELETLLTLSTPVHRDQFKRKFIVWAFQLVRLLSLAERDPSFGDKVDLEHPVESLYHIAFDLRKPKSGGATGQPGSCYESEVWALRTKLDQQRKELAIRADQTRLLEICRDDLQRTEDKVKKLKTCQSALAHLQIKHDQLVHANEQLETQLIHLQSSNERSHYFLLALTQQSAHPLPAYLPSDTCLKMGQDVAMRTEILNSAQSAIVVEPKDETGAQGNPHPCPTCEQLREDYDQDVARFTNLYKAMENKHRMLEDTIETLQQKLAMQSRVDRGQDITQTIFTQRVQTLHVSNHERVTQLQNQLKQVIHERNQLQREREKPLKLEAFDKNRVFLKRQYERLYQALGDYLSIAPSNLCTSALQDAYQAAVPSVALKEDYSEEGKGDETLSSVRARNVHLTCQLESLQKKLSSENVVFSETILPLIETVFLTRDLPILKENLETLEAVWGDQLLPSLKLMQKWHLDPTTFSKLGDLLEVIEAFTELSDLPRQFEYMENIFLEVLPVYGGVAFINTLRDHVSLAPSFPEFLTLFSQLFILKLDFHIDLSTTYAFLRDVYHVVLPTVGQTPVTVEAIRQKYLEAEYMKILVTLTGDTSPVSLEALVEGYVQMRKRAKRSSLL